MYVLVWQASLRHMSRVMNDWLAGRMINIETTFIIFISLALFFFSLYLLNIYAVSLAQNKACFDT